MRPEDLFEAMEGIGDDLLEKSEEKKEAPAAGKMILRIRPRTFYILGAAAVLFLVAGVGIFASRMRMGSASPAASAMATAEVQEEKEAKGATTAGGAAEAGPAEAAVQEAAEEMTDEAAYDAVMAEEGGADGVIVPRGDAVILMKAYLPYADPGNHAEQAAAKAEIAQAAATEEAPAEGVKTETADAEASKEAPAEEQPASSGAVWENAVKENEREAEQNAPDEVAEPAAEAPTQSAEENAEESLAGSMNEGAAESAEGSPAASTEGNSGGSTVAGFVGSKAEGAAEDAGQAEPEAAAEESAGTLPGNLAGFQTVAVRSYLSSQNGTNPAVSPFDLYLSLGMLAESTGGGTREEILSLLGVPSVPYLREQAGQLYEESYRNTEEMKNIFANAVFLPKGLSVSRETVETLADSYHASVFAGEMGSDAYGALLGSFLNESTEHFLDGAAGALSFRGGEQTRIVSTMDYRAPFAYPFAAVRGTETFAGTAGSTRVRMIESVPDKGVVYRTDAFEAVRVPMGDGNGLWIFLPSEERSVDELLGTGGWTKLITGDAGAAEAVRTDRLIVRLPAFDITSETALADGLEKMGLLSLFDEGLADLGGLLPGEEGAVLTGMDQVLRVALTKDGIRSAAAAAGSAADDGGEEETILFEADRPFLYMVTDGSGKIFLAGRVDRP